MNKERRAKNIILIVSFLLLIGAAVYWYIKLYPYLIWEDEGNTFHAVNNLVQEGFPIRRGLAESSQYYDPNFIYGSYWQYTLEIICRVPLQIISIVLKDPTVQTFTPLIITVVICIIVFLRRNNFPEELRMVIIVGNVLLSFSGYLMSSYHYVRYYWFLIAGTYICTLIVALRTSVNHDFKDTILTMLISMIPFCFHETGGVLIVVAALAEFGYWVRLLFAGERRKIYFTPTAVISCVVIVLLCVYIIPRIGLQLKVHGFSVIFSAEGIINYIKATFFLSDWSNISVAFISGILGLYVLACRENDIPIKIARICLLYFLVLFGISFVFGNLLIASRYNIASWSVFVLFIACALVHICRSGRRMIVCTFAVLGIILCLMPWFKYYPGWGLLQATRSDLAFIKETLDKQNNVVVVANHAEILDYIGDVDNLYRFRTEARIDDFYIDDDGVYKERGWMPFFGSVSSIKGFLNATDDDAIICFIGVKTCCDEDVVAFFSEIGTFGDAMAISKYELESRFYDYLEETGLE